MSHIADQIMAFVETTLTCLTTTGSNVRRSQVYDWPASTSHAISISLGSDRKVLPYKKTTVDSDLEINITAHVKVASSLDLDSELLKIRTEINQALSAATKPAPVIDYWESDVSAVFIDQPYEKPIASLLIPWVFRYRRLTADPENWS